MKKSIYNINMHEIYKIKEIKHNYMCTKDKIIQIIRVNSVNFNLMSLLEQKALLENFKQILLNLKSDYQIQIKILKLNQSNTINFLKEQRKLDSDIIDEKLTDCYISLLKNIENRESINTQKFFIVMSTDYIQNNFNEKLVISNNNSKKLISELKKIKNYSYLLNKEKLQELIYEYFK